MRERLRDTFIKLRNIFIKPQDIFIKLLERRLVVTLRTEQKRFRHKDDSEFMDNCVCWQVAGF